MTTTQISRRHFVQGAIATGAAMATGGTVAGLLGQSSAGAAKATATRYPLASLVAASGTTPLRAARGSTFVGGQTVGAMLYNSRLPGPLFVARTVTTSRSRSPTG
jgi:hypothetical protein